MIGFILGFSFCFISFCVAYLLLREVILKNGRVIRQRVERELSILEDATKDTTDIVYPDISKDIIESDLEIDNLLK
jgi:hypothetical protein